MFSVLQSKIVTLPVKNINMTHFYLNTRFILIALAGLFAANVTGSAQASDDWRENMKNLQYAPRYFGPNAFPLPELRSGDIHTRWEAELRGEYHTCEGDRTKDLFARLFVPIANGRAGFEISYIFYEYYNMTPDMVKERHAAGTSWYNGAHGDVVVSSFYRLLKSDKWADIMAEATLKTASGNRLVDARFTDAATYWFNLNFGRDVLQNADKTSAIRLQGLLGFYCWMTNDPIHRQNDAFIYSGGVSGRHKGFSAQADIVGMFGYKNNGDRPIQLRTNVNYEYRKNILSFRYKQGMKDDLYDRFSIAYIRCF
jgi:hypothetical protein